jgi:hypothetical protein
MVEFGSVLLQFFVPPNTLKNPADIDLRASPQGQSKKIMVCTAINV